MKIDKWLDNIRFSQSSNYVIYDDDGTIISADDTMKLRALAKLATEMRMADSTKLPIGCCAMPVGPPSEGHARNCPMYRYDQVVKGIEDEQSV